MIWDETPPLINHSSHFEKLQTKKYEQREDIKWKALDAMSKLEGWCTPQKASILIDFVMLLNATTIVEIGVFGGKSLVPMAYALQSLGAHRKVFGIDPWNTRASTDGMDGDHKDWWGQIDHEQIYKDLKDKIVEFGLAKNIILVRETSEKAPLIYDIDLLHIDGNHSDIASMIDVTKWVPLVRKGGLIFFDDTDWNNEGLAVRWLDEHCVKLIQFLDGNNEWGVWVKP